ncbi:TonB-dependent siderophore receptor [Thauera linaloolentis]|uniref:TonB-dependent siderophore receptor n=1 Tax=Thauera linaloolentis (strain DSM 12138 / JCM 21573 / CCUG 41526 / CIP 105981 / IAM 15112 / NBRC 102519 / 47Lol) TaxID=1123367 RepID=N6Z2H8_THAL4|nr:TonB-dependent receptor [Thauera linaloolentis]ENO86339.1 TonB-dependent siderophore receptor [Thauera linaloolentis 47Lol = DSM 12138]MCM8565039.1 TonB-dependent receptor [Thauera linaloolentis]
MSHRCPPPVSRQASASSLPTTRPLALAVHLLVFGGTFALGGWTPDTLAQGAAASAGRSYDIPAGPLGNALTRFSHETGIYLIGAGNAAEGKTSPGLKGSHSTEAGLAALLAGTGLEAFLQSDGSYGLRPAPADKRGETTLTPVTVTDRADLGNLTEGTGSYTTGNTNAATSMNLKLRETPQSVTVVTRQQMDDQALNSLGSVLEQTTGVHTVMSGTPMAGDQPLYARGYVIRSFQVDGLTTPVEAFTASSSYGLTSMDTALYDSVTTVRGATGLLSGAGDPSGSVSLARKRPTNIFQASASQSLGRWSQRRTVGDVGGPLNSAATLRGRLVAAYDEGGAPIDRYQGYKSVAYGVLEADLSDRTLLTLALEHGRETANGASSAYGFDILFGDGTPTPFSHSDSSIASWSTWQIKRRTFSAKLEHRFNDDWQAQLSISHNQHDSYRERGEAYVGNDLNAEMDAVYHLAGGSNRVNALVAKIDGRYELLGRHHDLSVGLNTSKYDFQAKDSQGMGFHYIGQSAANWNGNYVKPDLFDAESFYYRNFTGTRTETEQTGLYLATRVRPSDDLSFILGGRWSNWKTLTRRLPLHSSYAPGNPVSDDRKENGVFTPYVGIVYDLNKNLSTYASYTEIFNPQYNKDVGGSLLDPEEGTNYELGLKGEWFGGRLNASTAVFEVRKDNLAVWDDGNLTPGGDYAYRAEDATKGRGWELEVAGELAQGWQLQAGYTRMLLKDSRGKQLNTIVPVRQFKLFTSYTSAGLAGLTVGGGVVWQSKIYTLRSNPEQQALFTVKAYAVAGLMASYAFDEHLSLNVRLDNVFDKRYRVRANAHEYGAPRNLMAMLKYQF